MAPIILGYWNIRGLAQPIRLLLEQAGLEWEDKLYVCGPAPDYDRSDWLKEKETLGLEFPNLPYLLDGDVKLSQSPAIIRYVARKAKLDGQTEEEKQRVDLIVAEIADVKSGFTGMCYNAKFDELKGPYLEALPAKLEKVSKFLGTRPYFAGENLTYADFLVYEVLDQHKLLAPECLKDYANLAEFVDRIENLEKISAFMKTPKFIKYPLNGLMASFGG